jgi:hypothetical protein
VATVKTVQTVYRGGPDPVDARRLAAMAINTDGGVREAPRLLEAKRSRAA